MEKDSLFTEKNRCDIFGQVPIEISLLIARHFEINQIFRARQVSRRWEDRLSTMRCMTSSLGPRLKGSAQLCIPEQLSPKETISLKAKQVHTYRNGRASNFTVRTWGEDGHWDEDKEIHSRLAYANGVLAYLTSRTNTVFLLPLDSLETTKFIINEDEVIENVAISAHFLAVTTQDAKCIVFKLSDERKGGNGRIKVRTLSIVPAERHYLVVSGMGVIILHGPSEFQNADITIWNLGAGTAGHYSLPAHDQSLNVGFRKCLVIRDGKILVYFETGKLTTMTVYFARLDFSGKLESSWSIRLPNLNGFNERSSERPPTTPETGCVVLYSYVRWLPELMPLLVPHRRYRRELLRVCYNFDTDQIEVKENFVHSIDPLRLGAGRFFWWNEVAYFRPELDKPGALGVMDLEGGCCMKARMSFPQAIPRAMMKYVGSELNEKGQEAGTVFLGDDLFLISVWRGFLIVWCFDKRFVLPSTVRIEYGKEKDVASWPTGKVENLR